MVLIVFVLGRRALFDRLQCASVIQLSPNQLKRTGIPLLLRYLDVTTDCSQADTASQVVHLQRKIERVRERELDREHGKDWKRKVGEDARVQNTGSGYFAKDKTVNLWRAASAVSILKLRALLSLLLTPPLELEPQE
ncbi:hypothetical protein UPYG_G00031380 [Umbra pygmaea]|uniref:Uncharacterized protein n=1 Tax=Umbra pygmaea TaxID=75934 RepID=A0ABD0XMV1_UMBPY